MKGRHRGRYNPDTVGKAWEEFIRVGGNVGGVGGDNSEEVIPLPRTLSIIYEVLSQVIALKAKCYHL